MQVHNVVRRRCLRCLHMPSSAASAVYKRLMLYDWGVLFTVLLQIPGQAMHQILNSITCQPQHWGNTPSRSPWHFLMCRTLGSGLQLLCRATWCYVCLLTECHATHKWNNTENNHKNTAWDKYTNTHKQMHVHETQLLNTIHNSIKYKNQQYANQI